MSESIPPTSELGNLSKSDSGLGSLAQSARGHQLRQARGILLVIGALTIVVNGGLMFVVKDQVHQAIEAEVQKLQAQGMQLDPVKRDEVERNAVSMGQLITGVAIGLGVLFVVFGLIVYRYPVPVTITSLVLYIGSAAVFGLIDPTTLVSGIVFKIIIVVCLIKAVQAAIAYEKERTAQALEPQG